MPYIKQFDRDSVDDKIDALVDTIIHRTTVIGTTNDRPGILNYVISRLGSEIYTKHSRKHSRPIKYKDLNEFVGVLGCVQQEFYRRVIAKHEDAACTQNGDVY